MNHHYIRMPSGSIILVEDDRMVDVTREYENRVIANYALSLFVATLIGLVLGAAACIW